MTSPGMWKTRNELSARGEVIGRGCGLVLWVGSFWEGAWLSAMVGTTGKRCNLRIVGRLCVKGLGPSEEGNRLLSSGSGSSQETSQSTFILLRINVGVQRRGI